MEIFLTFWFVFLCMVIWFIAFKANYKVILFAAFFILTFVGVDMLTNGYQVQGSFTTTSYNNSYYQYNGTAQFQPTQVNTTVLPIYTTRYDMFVQMFGFTLVALGAASGFLGIWG